MTAAPTGPRPFRDELHDFAAAVGSAGPVTVVGGRTAWTVGGDVSPDAREVRAPAGIVELVPAEMVVRVGAGTPVADLDATLAEVGQEVALGGRAGGSVGGALAVGWSSLRRPRLGPARDALLEAAVVGADGRLVRAGGPTVKNVSGYDLCRLLVGSLGTIAAIGEVLLRTRPRPAASVWVAGPPPAESPLRPAAHLWDGTTTWVCLEGHPGDVHPVVDQLLAAGGRVVDGPPELPPHRWSIDPAGMEEVLAGTGPFVAELGIGTVHHSDRQPPRAIPAGVRTLNQRMTSAFDPTGRLNPGRSALDR